MWLSDLGKKGGEAARSGLNLCCRGRFRGQKGDFGGYSVCLVLLGRAGVRTIPKDSVECPGVFINELSFGGKMRDAKRVLVRISLALLVCSTVNAQDE